MVHFLADSFGSPELPIVGRFLIRPFREHHVRPLSITEHDLVERTGANAAGGVVVALLAWLPGVGEHLAAFLLFLSCWLTLTSEIHAWAHGTAPEPIRRLQKWGILLSPERHARHHRSHDSHYCITSGLIDRLADWFPHGLRSGRRAVEQAPAGFRCLDGSSAAVCNGEPECPDAEDELIGIEGVSCVDPLYFPE